MYRSGDLERGSYETVYEGGGSTPVYATSLDTGSPWNGNSYCQWYDGPYGQEYSTYMWQVRAVFGNGVSAVSAHALAEDAVC